MNTIEVEFNDQIKSFPELYKWATQQFIDYEKVEGIDNWEEYDFSIDCSSDQMKFKDMLQIRFIEELTEASISIPEIDDHYWEEIGDALNFFLSAYVMLGVDFSKFTNPENFLCPEDFPHSKQKIHCLADFSESAYPVIEKVGYLCNLLKNRPWTESNFLVSIYDFDIRLAQLWDEFWDFLGGMYLKPSDIFAMFYKKYVVNLHRRATGY